MPDIAAPEVKDVSVAELYAEKSAAHTEASAPASNTESPTSQSQGTADGAVSTEAQGGAQEGVLPSLKERVAELGFKDVSDDNEAQQRLIDAYAQQQAQYQQMQQQMEMLRWQMQMAQQGQAAPAQQQSTTPQQQGWWNAPKGNEQLRQQFMAGRTEDGSVEWKPNTPPQVIAEYEAELAFYNDWAQRLVRNPDQALKPFEENILSAVEKKIQETIQQYTQQQQATSFIEQQVAENRDVFYQTDPRTKDVLRDWRGEPMLSEAGIRFDSILEDLANQGMKNEAARWQYAQQIYKAKYGDLRQQVDPKVQQAQQIQQARAAHIAKTTPATHIPARNGQDAGGRVNGGRPEMQSLGGRFLAEHPGLVFN